MWILWKDNGKGQPLKTIPKLKRQGAIIKVLVQYIKPVEK